MHDRNSTDELSASCRGSVLGSLRALMPERRLTLHEALRIADLQADRLLHLQGVDDVPVPTSIVTALPRIVVQFDAELAGHGASGATDWWPTRRAWVIRVNPAEPRTRQRFTLMHEYKHIVDHYHPGLGGRLPRRVYGLAPNEYVADYFAGCLLMPKRWVKAAYCDGIQRPGDLAELFDVSVRAMEVRLSQLGLAEPRSPAVTGAGPYRMQPNLNPTRTRSDHPRPVPSSKPVRTPVVQEART